MVTTRAFLICAVVLTAGCAGHLERVSREETISIQVIPPTWIRTPDAPVNFSRETGIGAVGGAGVGALGGAALGALTGLACGPLAPLCIPTLAATGAATGGVVGAVTGAVVATPAPAPLDANVLGLRTTIDAYARVHNPRERFTSVATETIKPYWTIDSAGGTTIVDIDLTEIALQAPSRDMVSLVIQAHVTVRRRADEKPSSGRFTYSEGRLFRYASAPSDRSLWIENHDGYVAQSFEQAYRSIAEDMAADMRR